MNIYKVNFENNKPVSCTRVSIASCSELNRLGVEGSKVMIKWCIVDAEHEQHAIDVAYKTAKQKWGTLY